MKAYIYGIKNLVNNKIYVGSTKSPSSRKNNHFWLLKKGKHTSPHLQKAYDKYGKDKFAFYIIEECTVNNRTEREIHYLNSFNSYEREFGYNFYKPDENGFTCADSTREKLRQSNSWKAVPVDLYKTDGTFVKTYSSVNECARDLKRNSTTFFSILKGERKSYKGYTITESGKPFDYKPSPKQRDMSKYSKI